MDPNSKAYFNSALKLGLPVEEVESIYGFKMKLGKNTYYFFDRIMPNNNAASLMLCSNKFAVNAVLSKANIPVPKVRKLDTTLFDEKNLMATIEGLKFPLVIKPMLYTSFGEGVICNIPHIHSLISQCKKLVPLYPFILIEEFHGNLKEYRILVFQNEILEVIERLPATIIGDGKSTVQELVEAENIKRLQLSDILSPIQFDYEAELCLTNQKLVKESIPTMGRKITLAYTCNSSRGGSVSVAPIKMCKENKQVFLKVAKVLNLELVGIDAKCKNLHEPMLLNGGVIIEANSCPSVRIHEDGVSGVKTQVSLPIMKSFIYKHPISYLLNLFINKKILLRLIGNLFIVFTFLFLGGVMLTMHWVRFKL